MVCVRVIVLARGNCAGTSIKAPFGRFRRKLVQTRPHNSSVIHENTLPQTGFSMPYTKKGSSAEGLPAQGRQASGSCLAWRKQTERNFSHCSNMRIQNYSMK